MKIRGLKAIFIILIILVMMSVFVMGTMIALPVLKKSKVELAKENTSKIDKSYASESLSQTSAKNTSSVSTNSTDSNALTRNYEIKSEETWDVSKNQDGSVIAKFTLSDRTLRISGSGEMKNWGEFDECDWHNSQYTNLIKIVIIENGITNICKDAFYGCSSLENIEIPSSVTSIGWCAFCGCSSLTSIEIPSSVKSIGVRAFLGCSSLASIEIPSSVTSIDSDVFERCSSLVSINVNESNTKYMSEKGILFDKNKTELIKYPPNKQDIKEYSIPSSVTSIGDSAFEGCSSLTSIEIPSSVTSIDNSAFKGCSSLANIEIPSSVTSIEWETFEGCSNLASIEIPSSVTSIESDTFEGCSSLASIAIPSSVTSIGYHAFEGCSSLIVYTKADSYGHQYAEENEIGYILDGIATKFTTQYVRKAEESWDVSENQDGSVIAKFTLSDRTLRISGSGEMKKWEYDDKFDWHNSKYTKVIKNIIIKDGITSIGRLAFKGCSSLSSIEIPSSVTSIGERTFKGCSSLASIEIPSSVTSIEWYTFEGCSSLVNIEIPSSVTRIGAYAFDGCSSLVSINVNESNTKYMSEKGILFDKNKTMLITYPSNKQDIKEYIIPSSVTSIDSYAFKGCSSLTSIEIPSSVTRIGAYAFDGCSSLTSIEIPSSVTSIGERTFYGCSSLTSIEIPSSVTSIEWGTFYGCSSLVNIEIPSGVTSIDNYVFYGCSSLTSIEIPSGVTSIKWCTFEGCSNLVNIEIPSSVTSIEGRAFYGCSSLVNIEIPNSVTSIGTSAFEGCKSLKKILISKVVTNMRSSAIPKNTVIYTKSNTEGHRYAEEGMQGYIIDDEGPKVTFLPEKGDNKQKKYTTRVSLKDNFEEVGVKEDSLKYQWTQNTNAPTKESFNQEFNNGQEITKDTGDGKWYLWIYAEDNVGNETITRSGAFNLDNTPPEAKVQYSETEPTNKDVMVTIKLNEEIQNVEGWNLSADKMTLTKTYAENTSENGEVLKIKDLAGNETPTKVVVTNIDKIAPVTNVAYSTTEITNKDVIVTIKGNEKLQTVEGWTLSGDKLTLTKTYTENTSTNGENIIVKDLAGNETPTKVVVTNIDKIAPVTNITYSTTQITNKDVIATIKANEKVQAVEGWTLSEDKLTLTKTYTENTSTDGENITVKDLAGNEIVVNIKITNIDKNVAIEKVSYSTTEPTNKDVLVTIKASEKIQNVEGWKLSTDKMTLTKTYTENTSVDGENITIKDIIGNSTTIKIKVTNIDKIAPVVTRTYSTTEKTNYGVTVTIKGNEKLQAIEGWTLSEDQRTLTKLYINNTTEEGENITVKDLAGNVATVNVKISNIDNTLPVAKVAYSTTEATNKDVIVTINTNKPVQTIEGWTLSENKLTLTKTYTNNTQAEGENIVIKDLVGNTTTVNVKVTNIDKIEPTTNVVKSITEPTNQNVVVAIKASEKIQTVEGWTLSEDKLTLSKTYTNNTQAEGENIVIKDLVGNTTTVNVKVTNIDKIAPTTNVAYSITELTNQNVVVTIKASERVQAVDGWTLSEDKLILTKTYTNNTQAEGENVIIKDLVGNSTTVNVKVTNIDKVAPTTNVVKSITELTNQNVVVAIKANERIQKVDGWNLLEDNLTLTKTYTENTLAEGENVIIKDLVGNSTTVNVKVTNIDKVAPTTNVAYSITELTNQNVVVAIRANEKIQAVEGWTLSEDNLTLTKTYTNNTQAEGENIVIKDLVGNTTTVNVKVTNIDKIAPTTNVAYSITELTNQNVVVAIKASEKIQAVEGWTLSEDKLTLTKTYTENTATNGENVQVKDLAGNVVTVNVKIVNIDKVAPIANVTYSITELTNQNVVVTIKASERVQAVDGWTLSEDKLTLTKTYTNNTQAEGENVIIKDLVGNTTTVNVKVTNIDKIAPTTNVVKSITEPTNQNVVVAIRANERIQKVDGWNLLEDKLTLTKTYTNNTSAEGENIVIKDLVGNSTTVNVKITNIDKIAPTTNVAYSITELTNQNVVVAIKASEKIQTVEGWTLSEDKLTLSKTYTENTATNGENVQVKDLAGNVVTVNVKITNIDKIAPTTNVVKSITEPTNQNVVVVIKANERVQAVDGWNLLEDKLTLTKTYRENTSAEGENVVIKDLAGNITTVNVKINNIDRIAPVANVVKSITELTNQNVVVVIKANEKLQQIDGWNLLEDNLTLTKTYRENTSAEGENVIIKDVAGNSTTVNVKITNIDKTAPIANVTYSTTKPKRWVQIFIKSNEKVQEMDGWNLSEDKLTLSRTYTNNTSTNGENVTITDLAGNSTTVNVKVTSIDESEPTFTLNKYKIKNNYIIKIKPNTDYNTFIKDISTNRDYEVKDGNRTLSGTDIIKTGQKLTNELGQAYTLVVTGDLNGDGKISLVELARISKIGAGKITSITEIEKMTIDVNGDGKINIIDMAAISKEYKSQK